MDWTEVIVSKLDILKAWHAMFTWMLGPGPDELLGKRQAATRAQKMQSCTSKTQGRAALS